MILPPDITAACFRVQLNAASLKQKKSKPCARPKQRFRVQLNAASLKRFGRRLRPELFCGFRVQLNAASLKHVADGAIDVEEVEVSAFN